MAGSNLDPFAIGTTIVVGIILVAVLTPFFAAMFEQGDKVISEDSAYKESCDQTKATTNLFLNMLTPGTIEFSLLVLSILIGGLALVGFIIIKR